MSAPQPVSTVWIPATVMGAVGACALVHLIGAIDMSTRDDADVGQPLSAAAEAGDDARAANQRGGADPVGDDQAWHSGWGGIDECCAPEGGAINGLTITGPYRRPDVFRRLLNWLARG